MSNTRSVSDDDGRTIVCFRFADRFQRLVAVGTHTYAGNIYVAVAHAHEAEVLLGQALTGVGKQSHRTDRGGFGSLTTGVGVYFSIQNQDIDVAVLRDNVVQTAVTDIVCPAVTADDPQGFVNEVVGKFRNLGDQVFALFARFDFGQSSFDRRLIGLGFIINLIPGGESRFQRFLEIGVDRQSQRFFNIAAQLFAVVVYRQTHTITEFGVVFKQ